MNQLNELEEILKFFSELEARMVRQANQWSLHHNGDKQPILGRPLEIQILELKERLKENKQLAASKFVLRQIFLNPQHLNEVEFEQLLQHPDVKFKKHMTDLLRGWKSNSEGQDKYFSVLGKLALKNDAFKCPGWLSAWSNLATGKSLVEYLRETSVDMEVVRKTKVPSGQLQRLLYSYELYKADFNAVAFAEKIDAIKAHLPIISEIIDGNRDQRIYADMENILIVAAILNCRMKSKREGSQVDFLDNFMNSILMNPAVGDPRTGNKDYFWKSVQEFAKPAFVEWVSELNREDFTFFFRKEVLGKLDDNRVHFWRDYLGTMKRVQIVLGPKVYDRLVKFNKDDIEMMRTVKRAKVFNKNSEYSSAIFYFDKGIFIENHKTGAACYFFETDRFAKIEAALNSDGLPDYQIFTRLNNDSLHHRPEDSWHTKFEFFLRSLGIRPKSN